MSFDLSDDDSSDDDDNHGEYGMAGNFAGFVNGGGDDDDEEEDIDSQKGD